MTTIGIIAEFNPFHNGHKYLIDTAKTITNADNVIVICSGNYVQRGTPAIINKWLRARMAINNGADVVFELPVFYSTASAELFARSSVKFLTDLNCVDYLCFGCESSSLDELSNIASIMNDEPAEYKKYLKDYLKTGISFPKARLEAVNQYYHFLGISNDNFSSLISQPNNILAIEYIKALKYFNSTVQPVAIKRIGAGYDSLNLDEKYASATGIRNQIIHQQNISSFVPHNCTDMLYDSLYMLPDDFSSLLGHKLLSLTDFCDFCDVSKELSNRINNHKFDFTDTDSFIRLIQSKNFTYSGISRALLHILLNIKETDILQFIESGYFKYAQLLGFRRDSEILSEIKKKSSLDIVSKLSSYYKSCDNLNRKMLDISINADHLYRMLSMNKYKTTIPTEFERQIIIK